MSEPTITVEMKVAEARALISPPEDYTDDELDLWGSGKSGDVSNDMRWVRWLNAYINGLRAIRLALKVRAES